MNEQYDELVKKFKDRVDSMSQEELEAKLCEYDSMFRPFELKWNRQDTNDLFNELVDWSPTFYLVILKDGTERVLHSFYDEDSGGAINLHYEYYKSDDIVDFEDILLWRKDESMSHIYNGSVYKSNDGYVQILAVKGNTEILNRGDDIKFVILNKK